MTSAPPRLDVRGLSKTFGTTTVLHDATLTVLPGDVHGLAGQNGSGKTTLIKLLTGLHAPDPGAHLAIDGVSMRLPVRWTDVHKAGVAVVHQDLGLLDQLTVAENICVGGFPTTRGRINRRERDKLAAATMRRLGVVIDPAALVGELTAADRAEVALARAMRDHAAGRGLIILDESTRALTGAELRRIHTLLRRLAAEGTAILLISHSLTELLAVSDRLTILRDGRVVAEGLRTRDLDEHDIARRMLGSAVDAVARRSPEQAAGVALADDVMTVTDLRDERLPALTFGVRRGEILGLTGVPGSGYENIPYLLGAVRPVCSGVLRTPAGALDLTRSSVAACLRMGVVLVPERRERDGLAFDLNVRDNICLPALRHRGRPWFVARGWQHGVADRAAGTLGIRPRTPHILVKELSGGNQQKVLLAKWLHLGPSVMVLHEPTQAVDVGARQDILRALVAAADSGMGVIVVSSEAEDLAAICHRVLIFTGHELREADLDAAVPLVDQVYSSGESSTGSRA